MVPIARPAAPRQLLDEALFRSSLTRQRHRADRGNEPFALAVFVGGPLPRWDRVIAGITSATRDTDLAGWVQQGQAIGVILSGLPALDADEARRFERRLLARFSAGAAGGCAADCSIRLHILRGPSCGGGVDSRLAAFVSGRDRSAASDAVKRTLDVIGSLALLVALAPLFAVIAAAVKAGSRGPVLFKQERVGQMMKPFTFLKFRTMTVDATPALHREYVARFIEGRPPAQPAGTATPFKITNDPRVTRIGRVLRKTSLDELPQLWNVLRGDMSLVGPRPPIPYEVERYQPWHRRRILEAKPGLTGLWQVAGRSRTTFDEMVRLDLQYARTRSLWNDVKILLATPGAVIGGRGAC